MFVKQLAAQFSESDNQQTIKLQLLDGIYFRFIFDDNDVKFQLSQIISYLQ